VQQEQQVRGNVLVWERHTIESVQLFADSHEIKKKISPYTQNEIFHGARSVEKFEMQCEFSGGYGRAVGNCILQ
jgi:hypothetical protein